MYGRPTILFPLVVLALLALLTFWIDHTVQAPEKKIDGSSRHDPDYIMNNFVSTKTDVDGNLRYVLAAVEMRHYPDDDSTELVRPRFTQYGVGKPYSQIEGQRGTVSSNGDRVQFMDKVKVTRQATEDKGEMVMFTEYLDVTPKSEIAMTDRPVIITQTAPKAVVHAVGMVFDKKQQTLQLGKRVHVYYERPVTAKPVSKPAAKPKAKTISKPASTPKKPSSKPAETASRKTSPSTARIRRHYETPASR